MNDSIGQSLATLDWGIILAYLAFAIGVGIIFTRRASTSTKEFFLSGRTLPWWLVGTSMVATTFASDTPLSLTEFVRMNGMWKNWFWWNEGIRILMHVFLFAVLWRRAEIVTDNELIEMRYHGKPAAALRGFKAIYFGVVYNFIVMGWVIAAMAAIISVLMNVDKWMAVSVCSFIALFYAVLSGFWGVVATDLVQFIIAIAGSIYLAVVSLIGVGGFDGLLAKLNTTYPGNTNVLFDLFPFLGAGGDALYSMIFFIFVMWWAHHYADGGGYIIQRMASCKNEKHSLIATLWFAFTHMLRGWPWIIVALVSLAIFPDLSSHPLGDKAGYPLVMAKYLGLGFRGLMVASFLAAFMSTIDTHLNWGASYLMNDVYQRFIKKDASQKHYIFVTRLIVIFSMVGGGITAMTINRISAAWEFTFFMGCGIGAVLLLRWFWWRVNAISEIAALASSLFLAFVYLGWMHYDPAAMLFGYPLEQVPIYIKGLIIIPFSFVCWIVATFLSRPEPKEVLNTFYKKVVPGGAWLEEHKIGAEARGVVLKWSFVWKWFAGILFVYGATFAVGLLVFKQWTWGIACSIAMLIGFITLCKVIKDMPDSISDM